MPCCCVTVAGKDGKLHSRTLDASGVFDAAAKAVESWSRLWWFDSSAPVTVRQDDESWTVDQTRVRDRQKSMKSAREG
jgi:hypothetical protein